jgi:hypothetical protein
MYNKNQRKQTTNKLVTFKIGKNATLAANKQHKDKWAYTKYSITPFAFIPRDLFEVPFKNISSYITNKINLIIYPTKLL